MKKIIFWFFIISYVLLILAKNVNAQQNIYICENVQANPNLIQATSPQDVTITIQLTGGTQTEIPSDSLKLLYEAEYTTSSTGIVSVSEANPFQNPRVILAQIPSNLLNFTITQNYTFSLMKGNTVLRNATSTQECRGNFKVETDPNAELPGPCIYPEDNNRFTCRFDGQGWRLEPQNSFCDATNHFIINPACNSNNNDPLAFSRNPVCAPCVSLDALSKLKDHGETCNINANPSECLPTFVCRSSSSGQGKCLYNPHVLELNGQCIVGEDECTLNSTIALPGYEVLNCSSNGTCEPAPQNLQKCTSHDICKTTYDDTAFCDFNTGKCIIPVPTSTSSPLQGSKSYTIIPCYKSYDSYGRGSEEGIQTAFGCLPTSSGALVSRLLQIAIGMAGGIAFLLIVVGGLRIIISKGNPETMNVGKEIITSAIIGLLLIVFSVFILRVVGIDILAIPGFRT